ncbi:MAG: exosortase E/protease, VPEID-CTERM system [Candidatus Binataceae bacterium]
MGGQWVYAPLPTRILLPSLVTTGLSAATLLTWNTCREEIRRVMADSASGNRGWVLWLLIYALAVAGLTALMSRGSGAGTLAASHVTATAILILLALASWCLAAMPAGFWLRWISHNRRSLPAIAAIAVLTYVLARHYTPLVAADLPSFIRPLQRATLWVCAHLLRLVTGDMVFEPGTGLLGTKTFSVYVDSGCIGWESVTLFSLFFALYVWLYRSSIRFPHILLLLPIGTAILWLLNSVRIVTLILLGNWSETLAMDGFHSVAGWVFFNTVTLGIVIGSRRLPFFATDTGDGRRPIINPASPFLVPLLSLLATGMIIEHLSHPFNFLYPLPVLVGAGALIRYRKRIPFQWRPCWSPIVFGVLAFILVVLLRAGDSPGAANAGMRAGLHSLPPMGKLVWVPFWVGGAVLITPIAEELAFRGYLIRKLVSSDFEAVLPGQFTWLSFLGSSVVFGLLHTDWVVGTLVGMIFAAAVYRRGSLSDAITAHSLANGLLFAYILTTRRWYLWA